MGSPQMNIFWIITFWLILIQTSFWYRHLRTILSNLVYNKTSKLFSHRQRHQPYFLTRFWTRKDCVVWIYYFHPQFCIMQSWSKNEKQQIIFHLIFTIHSLNNKWNLESVPSVPIDLLSGKIPIQWFQKLPCMLKIKKTFIE